MTRSKAQISQAAKERIIEQLIEVSKHGVSGNWSAIVSSRNGFIQVQEVLPPMSHDPERRKT